MVVAKFKTDSVESTLSHNSIKNEDGTYRYEKKEMKTVKMSAVYSNEPDSENKKFWEASPFGELKLGTVNAAAAEDLKLGDEKYILFLSPDEYSRFNISPKPETEQPKIEEPASDSPSESEGLSPI